MFSNITNHTREIGNVTEDIALQHLKKNGLTLVTQNFNVRLGEIDIIMEDTNSNTNVIVFVEVKYRKNTNYGYPEETVTFKKQKKIRSTALLFIAKNSQYKNFQPRFDVVALLPSNTTNSSSSNKGMSINWIKNAF